MNLDALQIILWTIAYLLIIINSYGKLTVQQVAIPRVAVLMNYAWEINALIHSKGFWGHILWFGFDSLIFLHGIITMAGRADRRKYICKTLLLSVLLYIVFRFPKGMLISVFTIDFLMAMAFYHERKTILESGRNIIALTKLLGDFFAALYYAPGSLFVVMTGLGVFALNIAYLIWCIRDSLMKKCQCRQDVQEKAFPSGEGGQA